MSLLDRQGIPKILLRKDDESGTRFATALRTLQAFSVVVAEKGRTKFKMHRLGATVNPELAGAAGYKSEMAR